MADLAALDSLFYAAQPAVLLDGREEPNLANGLLTLLVEETTAGLFRCEATFGNWGTANGNPGYLYLDRQVFDFGKSLAIRIGEGQTENQIFEGRIMGLEAHYPQKEEQQVELVVLAEDRLQDLRMVRRSRTFEEVSDQDVIEQVASQHSLRTKLDLDGPTYRILAQLNQSDLAFLRERVRAIDAELWVEGDTLYAQARSRRQSSQLKLTYGQGLNEFSVLADLAHQRTSVAVSGWDVASKEAIEYEADDSAIRSELNGDQSGSRIVQSVLGRRAERLVHTVPLTSKEAQFMAESHYRKMARRFVTGQAVAQGDGRIRVGSHVELDGLAPLFDGTYYVTEARHLFDRQNGYRTTFTVERAGIGA